MPGRAPSPVQSENEFDIADALINDDSDAESNQDTNGARTAAVPQRQHNASELGLGGESSDEEFISLAQTASNRKSSNVKGRSVKKGGGFQAMGLNANLLKAVTRKGFSVPTPIQRKTIPLVLDGQDVVGMARTGSGKTAAFVIPMIEKLKAHSAQVGSRALILSPSRELALQTLKVVKELGRGTDLKATLLVGGDSLEDQFGFVASNPDILIATPGRFLHLKVEMGLDLSSIKYVVFDEADRLFEMGFALQLSEILHALPSHRQTLLFSATLPKSLVEFARAGLHEPNLVRLDTESKISPDLQSAFFSLQTADKEGALLHLIQDVIQIPPGPTEKAMELKKNGPPSSKKRKRSGADGVSSTESPSPHSTIVFTATKHHVEYIANLLRLSGYAVSYVYGALDQTARKIQVADFRAGLTNIMVVTDVAARGIDIPILANVINYDFPAQSKIFVHRVGRTARAGKQGWSYSLVRDSDLPYMLDLQLFLARRLCLGRSVENPNHALDVVAGGLVRDKVERCGELATKLLDSDVDLAALKTVAGKGEKLYNRTRHSASTQSVRRAKQIIASEAWTELHPLFNDASDLAEAEREKMLARISGFRPQETVFELGRQGQLSNAGEVIRKQRQHIKAKKERAREAAAEDHEHSPDDEAMPDADADADADSADDLADAGADMASASEDELEVTFTNDTRSKGANKRAGRDASVYMSYTPSSQNMAEEKAYGVHSGGANAHSAANFLTEARSVALDMTADEGKKGFAEPSRATGQRWDKKSKKYVSRANDEDGSRADAKGAAKGGAKIRSESGRKIAASFRSGRFDAWRRSNRVSALPRVGEDEAKSNLAGRFSAEAGPGGNRRWRHNTEKAPKPADPKRDDYYSRKKRVEAAKEKRVGRFKFGDGKEEVRPMHKVRQQRAEKEKRQARNARPSRKK